MAFDYSDMEGFIGGAMARLGDEVIIFGSDGNNTISVDSVALLNGTINYEIVCSVTKRVPRVYIQNNEIIAY
mgnify:CR=1 FL=1